MTWKHNLRLDDLPYPARLEAFCQRCQASRYYTVQELITRYSLAQAHLDQVEKTLRCTQAHCQGDIVLYEINMEETEAFQNGMP